MSNWDNITAELNGAFGAGNVTVGGDLTNLALLLTFDALWVTERQPANTLSAVEIGNLQAFAATGRPVALIGENNAWSAWNNSLLTGFGGSYAGANTSATLSPAVVHSLTAGVGSLLTNIDGIAVGGTSLFSQNVITLWAPNVVSILSVNLFDDVNGTGAGNLQFASNLADFLGAPTATAVPEPATLALLGFGLAAAAARRRRAS